jgi:hypothetical protein
MLCHWVNDCRRFEESNVIFKGQAFQEDIWSRDSSVGIATGYGLGGQGIEPRWGRDFPHPSRPALGHTQPPTQWLPGLFHGGKAAGAWCWPPTPYCAEVKGRVELYLYSPFGLPWPVLRWTLLYFYLELFSQRQKSHIRRLNLQQHRRQNLKPHIPTSEWN